jgi:hypothetical protein
MDDSSNLIERADELDDRITEATKAVINDLVHFQDKTRHLTYLLGIVSSVLVVVVTVVILAVVKINDNASTLKGSCEQLNQSNANQVKLWEHILDLPPAPDETPAQKQTKIEFEQFVKDTFRPLDCSQPKVIP